MNKKVMLFFLPQFAHQKICHHIDTSFQNLKYDKVLRGFLDQKRIQLLLTEE